MEETKFDIRFTPALSRYSLVRFSDPSAYLFFASPEHCPTMFCKATLITVALALIASASPIVVPTKSGIRVPLKKRGSLTNDDGTFNYDKVVRHIVRQKKCVFSRP